MRMYIMNFNAHVTHELSQIRQHTYKLYIICKLIIPKKTLGYQKQKNVMFHVSGERATDISCNLLVVPKKIYNF